MQDVRGTDHSLSPHWLEGAACHGAAQKGKQKTLLGFTQVTLSQKVKYNFVLQFLKFTYSKIGLNFEIFNPVLGVSAVFTSSEMAVLNGGLLQ